MRRRVTLLVVTLLLMECSSAWAQRQRDYSITPETLRGIERAVPDKPLVLPKQPRRVLVYGRMPTHPESVVCCFKALEILARKTGAFERENIRVLLTLDLDKTADPGKRADKDYLVSWLRPYRQGRVFYTSLGHCATAYTNSAVLTHYLAGIQYATGDLAADDAPLR